VDVGAFLSALAASGRYSERLVHVEDVPARQAAFGKLAKPLHPTLARALQSSGIRRLYTHQVEGIEHVRSGRDVVVVTGTASGKTLCYIVPVLEALLADPLATALLVYPTKALAQDQLRGLVELAKAEKDSRATGIQPGQKHGLEAHATQDRGTGILPVDDRGLTFAWGTYDGDTPQTMRRKLRAKGNVILTNPDMLHQGILPGHARWNRFFTNLRYVVLDEVHAYRGVFGSNVANVIRRLRRVCRHYGSDPVFIACSATIANPAEHVERIIGGPVELVDADGSPRGAKKFVLWNPPLLGAGRRVPNAGAGTGDRKSALGEAIDLLTSLVGEDIQTIAFVRTRLGAELIFRSTRENLQRRSRRLAERVHAYRGGYLPEERRDIEKRLASGDILGVASTNALELGIDIGGLDACIIVGYPGTIASTWQQAGRAGRGESESVVFLVAQNAPIDQYLVHNHEYLFGQTPENAVIDPDNPHVAVGHVESAVYELPLPADEVGTFGPYAQAMLDLLAEDGCVRLIDGKWYWADTGYPAGEVNLRNISGPVYTIMDRTGPERVVGTMDELSAMSQLHTHAVYIHGAETYFVSKLDLQQKVAYVERENLDYYTQAVTVSKIKIDETLSEAPWRNGSVATGDVTVTTAIPMFKKVKFHSRDSLGFEELELPPQVMETVAMWLVPPQAAKALVTEAGRLYVEGLIGIANVMVEVAPLFVMCDVTDIGAVVDSSNLGVDAVFLYDKYPGGMGFAERLAELAEPLVRSIHTVIAECPCDDGCPSCVGAAMPVFATSDLESTTRGRIPDKHAALVVLHRMLEMAPYVPPAPRVELEPAGEQTPRRATRCKEGEETEPIKDLGKRLNEILRKHARQGKR